MSQSLGKCLALAFIRDPTGSGLVSIPSCRPPPPHHRAQLWSRSSFGHLGAAGMVMNCHPSWPPAARRPTGPAPVAPSPHKLCYQFAKFPAVLLPAEPVPLSPEPSQGLPLSLVLRTPNGLHCQRAEVSHDGFGQLSIGRPLFSQPFLSQLQSPCNAIFVSLQYVRCDVVYVKLKRGKPHRCLRWQECTCW